jgi:GT2 family glycosyltransferase
MFGVVVNYFSKETHPSSVKQSAKFAVSLLKNCSEVTSIVLVDGSAKSDLEMKSYCESLDINYAHSGTTMSFGEAYNYGVSLLSEDWIALMASDIYVYPNTFTAFCKFIENHPALNIGCLIPYLTKCDLPVQQASQYSTRSDCYASIMSFNLNVFKKDIFEKTGGLCTTYSGNFNDIDMCLKLQNLNLDIFLVGDANVVHYGSLTLRHGTTVDNKFDYQQFYADHPELYLSGGLWNLRINQFLRNPILKLLYRLNSRFGRDPHKRKARLDWVLRLVPSWQKI